MSTFLAAISILIFIFISLKALYRPWWTLVLVLSYVAYEQFLMSYFTILARQSYIVNVWVGLISLSSVLCSLLFGRRPFQGFFNLNTVLVYALYVVAIFGVSYSMMPAAGMYFVRQGIPTAGLMLVLLPLAVCSIDHIRKASVPIMFVGSMLVLMVLLSPRTQIYGSRLFIEFSRTMGGSDNRGNPLALAELGGLMILFGALMEPSSRVALINLLRTFAIILGVSIAFLVGSRGQLVFAILLAVILYPLAHTVRDIRQFFVRAGAVGIFFVVMAVSAKVFLSTSRSTARFTTEDIAVGFQGRVYFASAMLSEYASNPAKYLQGLGTGSFNAIVRHEGDGYLYPHNLIIEVLTHHGLIGLALLAGIFSITAYHLSKLWRLALRGLADRSVVAILIAITGYLTLLSMKQGSFILIPMPFYAYLIVSKLSMRSEAELADDGFWDCPEIYTDSNSENEQL